MENEVVNVLVEFKDYQDYADYIMKTRNITVTADDIYKMIHWFKNVVLTDTIFKCEPGHMAIINAGHRIAKYFVFEEAQMDELWELASILKNGINKMENYNL